MLIGFRETLGTLDRHTQHEAAVRDLLAVFKQYA
jgi:hypothetical protein